MKNFIDTPTQKSSEQVNANWWTNETSSDVTEIGLLISTYSGIQKRLTGSLMLTSQTIDDMTTM